RIVRGYSSATGFSATSSILDQDTFCQASSSANDTTVCETGSLSSAANHCQNLNETVSLPAMQNNGVNFLDHDVPPIPAAMNAAGQAIVVYQKKFPTGSIFSPNCLTVGTF